MGFHLHNTRRHGAPALRLAVAALLAAIALMATGPQVSAQQKTPVRVAYVKVVTWLPAMIAKEEGYFDKHGLDATMTPFTQVANLPGTLGKQFDFAPTTAPDMLNAVANGINLVAVAGDTVESSQNKVYEVLVRADSGITRPKDLTGKRIAGPGVGSIMHVALVDWVKRDGGDPSGIVGVEVPFPNMMDQLKAGRVDAVEQLQPFVGVMKANGFKSIGDPLLSIGDPLLFPYWISDGDWARANRGTIKKFTDSMNDALALIKSDEKKARTILGKYTGLPEAVVTRIPLPHYDFGISPEQLVPYQQLMVRQGYPVGKLDMKKLVVTGN
jgi:ABC-type nitrate/sulfonate/bicarbonate transport system substrate-binding protein